MWSVESHINILFIKCLQIFVPSLVWPRDLEKAVVSLQNKIKYFKETHKSVPITKKNHKNSVNYCTGLHLKIYQIVVNFVVVFFFQRQFEFCPQKKLTFCEVLSCTNQSTLWYDNFLNFWNGTPGSFKYWKNILIFIIFKSYYQQNILNVASQKPFKISVKCNYIQLINLNKHKLYRSITLMKKIM